MRKFSSYGPIDTEMHYYAPREELISKGYLQLRGEDPDRGGHYITVWAPRQRGKSWVMNQISHRLRADDRFDVLKLELEDLKTVDDPDETAASVAEKIIRALNLKTEPVRGLKEFARLFESGILKKPLILILDEFDALAEDAISQFAGIFRNIYNTRRNDPRPSPEKEYLLHGIALIGVRSVLGIENRRGSPFNVQRSLHIPGLNFEETAGMFRWHEAESGQKTDPEVLERLFSETRGHPGLIGWFGELLTETYPPDQGTPVTLRHFESVFRRAVQILPNNTVLNIISKAQEEPHKTAVLDIFRTHKKTEFTFDDPVLNFLYLNGVIDVEEENENFYVRFSNPFIQKRLFNRFARDMFGYVGKIYEPFEDLSDTVTADSLNIKHLIKRYESYLKANRDWLLKDAPRRKDLRVFEAVFHFNLYMYIFHFLDTRKGRVFPEFPAGNGKIDLLVYYAEKIYGLELKSYTDEAGYRESLGQAARYGKDLGLPEIYLIFFVEYIDDANRMKYEAAYTHPDTGVTVIPVFAQTGDWRIEN